MSHSASTPSSPELSSSDIDSDSTSISSVSQEASPVHIILPSPSFIADKDFIGKTVQQLERGRGGLLFVCIANAGSVSEKDPTRWLSDALKETISALSMDARWARRATNIANKEAEYFVSSDEDSYDICDIELKLTFSSPSHTPSFIGSLLSDYSLRSVFSVSSPQGQYTLHVLERPLLAFPLLASPPTNVFGVPTLAEWHRLWASWDLVTLGMIPHSMLHQKPIDLRHRCLFYLGHIPTFLDMLLSKVLGEPNTKPKNFTVIFERGIDPHVDDPDHCHAHSEVPEADEDWPTLSTILAFRDRVRARLLQLYADIASGARPPLSRALARTLVMTLEHEGFHVETLLYMLIQRAGTGTIAPPGFVTPPWTQLAAQWACTPPPTSATTILGPALVLLGHEDSEADDSTVAYDPTHEFGWDNESPPRSVQVGAFRVDWRPISNGEYEAYWRENQRPLPTSWVSVGGEIKVRTLYGPVPFDVARHWPVLASYDDLAAYARSKGGHIPTEAELRLFLDTYEVGHAGGANVGFKDWHPVPATTGGMENGGRGSNGGVWEWTSDAFDGHEGLVPTKVFPGYSTDFFDGKHQVVLGASYATIPRLAGRRTARNFYQHNYPYAWVGARVAYYDL